MSVTTTVRADDVGKVVEQRREELRQAIDDYLNGRISVDEFERREQELLPNYDEMGQHLFEVARATRNFAAHPGDEEQTKSILVLLALAITRVLRKQESSKPHHIAS